MATASAKLSWNDKNLHTISQKAVQALFKLGYDIAAQARSNAPVLTGALRNTIGVREVSDGEIEVKAGGQFGSRLVDYAYIRELGPNRDPSTEHYMENAARSIMSGDWQKKYFGGITE